MTGTVRKQFNDQTWIITRFSRNAGWPEIGIFPVAEASCSPLVWVKAQLLTTANSKRTSLVRHWCSKVTELNEIVMERKEKTKDFREWSHSNQTVRMNGWTRGWSASRWKLGGAIIIYWRLCSVPPVIQTKSSVVRANKSTTHLVSDLNGNGGRVVHQSFESDYALFLLPMIHLREEISKE